MKTEYERQAETFMKKTHTKIKIEYEKYDYHFYGDDIRRNIYKVIIKRNGKQMTIHFGQSYINTELGNPPSYYDILACLTKDDPGNLYDFCACFGYAWDDENAQRTHKLCEREWQKVNNLFFDVIDELRNIQ